MLATRAGRWPLGAEMAWRDELLQGSFRGVEFHLDGHEGEIGRRVAVHEFPGRDKPLTEDLGRKARVFSVDAFVMGADYMAQRNALMQAVEQAGPGELVHPYLGRMRATVVDCKVSETTKAGGMARFAIKFIDASGADFKVVAVSTPDQVAAKAVVAFESANAAFQAKYNTAKRPDVVARGAAGALGGLAGAVAAAASTVRAELAPLAELQRQVDDVRAAVGTLVYAPASVAQAAAGMVQQLVRSVANGPADALSLAKTLWRFGSLRLAPSYGSVTAAAAASNAVEFAVFVRAAAVTEAARALAKVGFDSYDAAAAQREEFGAVVDELLDATTDDATFDAMRGLRAEVLRDISARGAVLARLARVTLQEVQPVMVVAQQVWGDGGRGDEVMGRNAARVMHPLFAPTGVALEVLANG